MKLIRKQKQKTAFNRLGIAVAVLCAGGELAAADAKEKTVALEEVVVTAQKREQSLQDTPIAISVLNAEQLERQRVSSLGDLMDGAIPSLRIHPVANEPSALVMAIRGNGPVDIGQTTRDGSVAVYMDDFYLGRSQGLDMELAELERIEVLRGPQGTLFGRNATGGAISLVSKRPSGEFGFKQTLDFGSYNQRRSVTRLDLPEWAGVRVKLNYLRSQRNGWVNNTDEDESDYNAYKKSGSRLSVEWQPDSDLTLNYFYSDYHTSMTQNYFQLYEDQLGVIGVEPGRQTQTRVPITPLEPTINEQQQHGLRVNYDLADNLMVQSLTSYRELDNKARNNFGGAAYFNGALDEVDIEHEQFSQELRFLGGSNSLEWTVGLHHYEANVDEAIHGFFSLDIFGDLTGVPFTPLDPLIESFPQRKLVSNIRSQAMYGQAAWTPPAFDNQLKFTLGLRHSREKNPANKRLVFQPVII